MASDTTTEPQLPLTGIRAVELGDALAAAYAGRLLADLGADVVKVERPGGDPLRAVGPFADGSPDPEASVPFAYYHAGKRSVLADAAMIQALTERADVLVRCTATGADWLDDEALARVESVNPGLVTADITTRGRGAGDRGMSDLLALAAGGLLSLNGEHGPVRVRGEMASVHAAAQDPPGARHRS